MPVFPVNLQAKEVPHMAERGHRAIHGSTYTAQGLRPEPKPLNSLPLSMVFLVLIGVVFAVILPANGWSLWGGEWKGYVGKGGVQYIHLDPGVNETLTLPPDAKDIEAVGTEMPQARVDYPTASIEPFSLAPVDLDKDGDRDIVTADYVSGSLTFMENSGGAFRPIKHLAGLNGPYMVRDGNIDGSGPRDLVVTCKLSSKVRVLFNLSRQVDIDVGTYPTDLVVDDLNGDGRDDVAVMCIISQTLNVIFFDGKGNEAKIISIPVPGEPMALSSYHYLGKGVCVAYRSEDGGGVLAYMFQDRSPHKVWEINLGPECYPVAMTQIYGPFFALATNVGEILCLTPREWSGNGEGNGMGNENGKENAGYVGGAIVRSSVSVEGKVRRMYRGDMDSDGEIEFGILKEIPFEMGIYHVRNGLVQYDRTISTGSYPRDAAFCDVDGDGLVDIMFSNENDNSITLVPGMYLRALNPGIKVGYWPRGIDLFDLDSDGHDEALVASAKGESVEIYDMEHGKWTMTNRVYVEGYCRDVVAFHVGSKVRVAVAIEDRKSVLLFDWGGINRTLSMVGNISLAIMPFRLYVIPYSNTTAIYALDKDMGGMDVIDANDMRVVLSLKVEGIVALTSHDNTVFALTHNGTVYRFDATNATLYMVVDLHHLTYPWPGSNVGGYSDIKAFEDDDKGDVNFLVTHTTADTIYWLRIIGGCVQISSCVLDNGTMPERLAVCDLYGDGKKEVTVTCLGNRSDLVILKIEPRTGFITPQRTIYLGRGARALDTGDVDGDGHIDIAVVSEYNQRMYILDPLTSRHDLLKPTDINVIGGRTMAVFRSETGGYYKVTYTLGYNHELPRNGVFTTIILALVLLWYLTRRGRIGHGQ